MRLSVRLRQGLSSLAVVFHNRSLRLVAGARLASVTGRWASTIALAVFAYRAGGAADVGVLGVVRILPAAFAGPVAAWLLGRVRPDRILLLAGLARTVVLGVAGFIVLDGSHAAPVFALVAAESFLSTMVRPLQSSALPFLARVPGELTAANLTLTTIESAGMLLGPALSGVLLEVWGPGSVLLVTAVAYFASSTALIARIPAWQSWVRTARPGDALVETIAGIRTIKADPELRLIVGLYCAENLVTGALNVLVVIAALKLLDLGDPGVGALNAAIGIGGLAGAIAAAAFVGGRRIASGFGVGLVLCGVPIVLIGVPSRHAAGARAPRRPRDRRDDRRLPRR